jgi:hypothetical protein
MVELVAEDDAMSPAVFGSPDVLAREYMLRTRLMTWGVSWAPIHGMPYWWSTSTAHRDVTFMSWHQWGIRALSHSV